mmetsp:Transcript_17176/g.24989  ORF Transcript_17176/g.24989 Transcript_17176/m.24989 type:complete len:109 (+) Transcript_17176:356-682(+)
MHLELSIDWFYIEFFFFLNFFRSHHKFIRRKPKKHIQLLAAKVVRVVVPIPQLMSMPCMPTQRFQPSLIMYVPLLCDVMDEEGNDGHEHQGDEEKFDEDASIPSAESI